MIGDVVTVISFFLFFKLSQKKQLPFNSEHVAQSYLKNKEDMSLYWFRRPKPHFAEAHQNREKKKKKTKSK